MKKTTKTKKKISDKSDNKRTISAKKYIIFIVIIAAITGCKLFFSVPVVINPPENTDCASYKSRITMSEYIAGNLSTGCEIYEIRSGSYVIENLATFIISTAILFGGDQIIQQLKKRKNSNK